MKKREAETYFLVSKLLNAIRYSSSRLGVHYG